ncbi:UdgX family uracil-DNA binding protein [Noviherbaspirillum aridicola]|uniref:Type-4 uracil-DNA glycosylase n=1 Tax=Noviherbaspirillum aridicola TaxID=2849687 RepID=A0ABQ4Q518_9BURK|nr:UdgX family uracil-DNA binding protein [Noviherbaspirillum aridicola]GIZ52291.1 uracil-DNA glycosylase [Noviherbaspirillum aridicola]
MSAVMDFAAWRGRARALLAAGVAPQDAQWGSADDLFGGGGPEHGTHTSAARISGKLLAMLEQAACHRSEDRWAFLYRVLWRWQQGQRDVMSAADEDGARLHAMVKTVRREAHKMHAFLRFRERPEDAGAPRFIAWFEPEHDVLRDAAAHFAQRMGRHSWLIATPQGCAVWDGACLAYGPPLPREACEARDSGEALWLAYYRSTFNPARLNPDALTMHMPVRYWKNLPEAPLIPAMLSEAASGASRLAQAGAVGARGGKAIALDAEKAMPPRALPHTLDDCRRCPLWRNATQAVPGCGPARAPLMLVGEQPGDQEDLAGQPFVGPAGRLLDDAFARAGIGRDEVYLTNAVKHFKWEARGKRRLHRTPAQQEAAACRAWLEQELAQVQPRVVVALGATALASLLGTEARLNDLRGVPVQSGGRLVIPAWHPAYVLRLPDREAQAAAFDDIVRVLRQAQALATDTHR